MDTLQRFIQAFLGLSAALTAIQIAQDRGGGRFLLTLIAAILVACVLPYLGSLWAMRRLPPRWAVAAGIGGCTFGALDVVVRTQAFNFPTDTSNGAMALWMPIYSLAIIPAVSVISYAGLAVLGKGADATVSEAESRRP